MKQIEITYIAIGLYLAFVAVALMLIWPLMFGIYIVGAVGVVIDGVVQVLRYDK